MIKKEKSIIIIILIIQTIIFVVAGINKSYIHMDEAYSFGLTNYNKTEIQANEDFYNTWHSKDYFENYLSVNANEINNFLPVYENQKNDVHPPLYYLLLRIAMGLHIGSYSKWTGIILNIIIYLFVTIFMYLIIKKLLGNDAKCNEKSAILALLSSITLASINNVIYIRMYALSTLNIVVTTYLHMKLLDRKENSSKLFFAIGLFSLLGSLTHYYYLFYLAMLFIMFVTRFIKEKNYKELTKYVGTIIIAAATSLFIFPYSIQHIFFGYRGQGVINNLTDISKFVISILQYLLIINVYIFNNALFLIIIFIAIMFLVVKKLKINNVKNKYINYIVFPTLFYFILVAISSPWRELRYIMPIGNLIFIIVIYYITMLLKKFVSDKTLTKTVTVIFAMILITPFISNIIINLTLGTKFRSEKETNYSSKMEITQALKGELNLPFSIIERLSNFINVSESDILLFMKDFKVEPEVMYSCKKEIVETIQFNTNLPGLYLFNSSNNRFLDDILLFTNIKESYIAKDIICNTENIKNIMIDKDFSNGIVLFINDGQNNDELINVVKKSLELNSTIYLKRLNACDVYILK